MSPLHSEQRQYRILELLGEGGFGKVYKAEMLGVGGFSQKVALKIIRADVANAEEALRRLRDEARILGYLQHRAVVRVQGLTLLKPGWTVVMEFLDGVDSGSLIREKKLPPSIALEIVMEIAGVLDVAWRTPGPTGEPLHLLHRDIKPANIRITLDGGVKVLDFGAARADLANREGRSKSVLMGTLQYLAPERLLGEDTPAGDIFSLGVTLGEMLANRFIKGSLFTDSDALPNLLQDARANLVANGKAPEEVLALVTAMVSRSPEERPNAAEVLQRCRSIRRHYGDGGLSEWAPDIIPTVHTRPPQQDALSGLIFVETPSVAIAKPQRSWAMIVVASLGSFVLLLTIVVLLIGGIVWYGQSQSIATSSVVPEQPVLPVEAPVPPVEAPVPPVEAPVPPVVPVVPTTVPKPVVTAHKPVDPPMPKEEAPPPVEAPTVVPNQVSIRLSGDALRVTANGTLLPGTLEPGSYRISAQFPSGEFWNSQITFQNNGTLDCSSAQAKCKFR